MPKTLIADAPAPGRSRGWTLAVIGCEKESITLDACLIFVPPGTDMAEVVRIGGEAGIPHPYLRSTTVMGIDFDVDKAQIDGLHPYVG